MDRIQTATLEKTPYTGRNITKIIEKGGVVESKNITMGIAEFSNAIGPMLPHKHGEEGIYVLEAVNCWTRRGDTADTLEERHPVETGMVLRYLEDEWHIFEFEGEGYLRIVFFFGTGSIERPK